MEALADDVVIDRLRHQQDQAYGAVRQRAAERIGIEQPKGQVEILARVAVRVAGDLARVQDDPQPKPQPRRHGTVVPVQAASQPEDQPRKHAGLGISAPSRTRTPRYGQHLTKDDGID